MAANLKVFNLRFGFATNSSSVHSIVVLAPGAHLDDRQVEGSDFGWREFHAASAPAKKKYLAEALYQNLRDFHDDRTSRAMVAEWVGAPKDEKGNLADRLGYRQISLPATWDGKNVDREFFDQVKCFILRDDVAIVGGCNDREEHELPPGKEFDHLFNAPPAQINTHQGRTVCRRDPAHDYWTLFSRDTGRKVRFSFDENTPAPTKAYAPELVDLKITDYCGAGCAYCYQGSSPAGKHADPKIIARISDVLGELKVFEAAIGGGEPTTHPDFIAILRILRAKGVVPNFSTRRLDWLRDPAPRQALLDAAGAFAYSAASAREIEAFAALLNSLGISRRPPGAMGRSNLNFDYGIRNLSQPIPGGKTAILSGCALNIFRVLIEITRFRRAPQVFQQASVHYVIGAGTDVAAVMAAAYRNGLPLTLLAYKRTGRGKDFPPRNDGDWLAAMENLLERRKCPELGLDTVLAAQNHDRLQALGIPRILYETDEGKFSMYIDAVNGKAGPSSFRGDDQMIALDLARLDAEGLAAAFAQF